MKKIVYFDIDGTLLDVTRNFNVSAKTQQSLRQLRADGNLTIINTGRSLACIPQEILDLNFDGIIAGCGTYVEFHGQVLFNRILDSELVDRIIETFSREKTDLLLEGPDFVYTLDTVFDPVVAREAIDLFNIEGRRRRISETPVRINKISYLIRDSHSDRAIIEALQDQLHFIIYPTDIREGIPPGCNKKTGMILLEKWLQREIDFKFAETLAFGDSMNDMDMLKHATRAIAMGNSDSGIHHLADFVTLDVVNDGIEYALKHYNLI
ncbi:MAG: HAD-IIB family hydrolase [Clostridiales bacterium]|jgi:Cof subfamily protein (haloacid dehalogenase superfamily)|nr:HAD-IIB family hydrolase [Bacillota bacterium]NLB08673.1 HAD-IIB family hydrolase [Clostridiales bacterium]